MAKVVFGFVGLMGSGKGSASKYLEKYGSSGYRYSTMLRNLCDRLYLDHARDNLIKMSEAVRDYFGENILAKTMARDVENDVSQIVVVEGIRRMADIEYLKKLPNFILIEIYADINKRLERIKVRGENPDDATKTMEQFVADHQRSTEVSIAEVASFATERIDNGGTVEELNQHLDDLIKKYANKN